MCIGQGAYAAQVDAYEHQVEKRSIDWNTARNRWSMKIGRFKRGLDEGVLAFSRKIGAIQRRIGLEREKFLVQNEAAFKNYQSKRPVNEGGRARGYGRNQALAFYTGMTQRQSNLLRGMEAADVAMLGAGRELNSYRNKLQTQLGFQPIPGLAPVKPRGPSQLEFMINSAQVAVGLATGVQNIGQQAGWQGQFFQGNSNSMQSLANQNYGVW